MDLVDLKDAAAHSEITTDICIVGSGPAGITLAKELLDSGMEVCIVESGGLTDEDETQALYEVDNAGDPRKEPQKLVRQRVFGGSSTTWSGRCTAFDPIDFEKRSWVEDSGWPFDLTTLNPYLDRATKHLGLGPNVYDENLFDMLGMERPKPSIDQTLLKPTFWQFSRSKQSTNPIVFGKDLLNSQADNLTIYLHANLTHINTDQAGEVVESVDFQSLDGNTLRIVAKNVVLCCGGVENARLLLASNNIIPEGVGNKHDMVGRNLIDHLGGVIGSFDPQGSADIQARFGRYWLESDSGRQSYLHGLALSEQVQAKEELLNAAAFIEEYEAPDDPWHALKRVAKKIAKRGGGKYHCDEGDNMFWRDESALAASSYQINFRNDVITLLKNTPSLLKNIYRKQVNKRPPIIKNARVDLYTLIEQMPNNESRLTLSSQKDALGMPLSKINWQIDEKERAAARRLGELITLEFKHLGLTPPKLAQWLYDENDWQPNLIDRAHPTGATKMSEIPEQGVVDINCAVHNVAGLYIAGSSVFPTAGHGNPTLMILALTIRLADFLKAENR